MPLSEPSPVDPDSVNYAMLIEEERVRLHHELGCDGSHGAFALGDLGGLARRIFTQTPYGPEVTGLLLEHAGMPALGVTGDAPGVNDYPAGRQGCLITFWRASLRLSREQHISFAAGMEWIRYWMDGYLAQHGLPALTRAFHPSYPPASPESTSVQAASPAP